MRESDLRSVFIKIGTPSALGVRRDERERECCYSSVSTQFQDNLSVDAIDGLMMRIYYQ